MEAEVAEKPRRGRKSNAQRAAEAAAAIPVMETAEFKAAVAEAAAKAVEGILSTLNAGREVAGTTEAPAASIDNRFAEGLAMALAQLTDQGTGRKRVAPEIIRKRGEARDLMEALILEARAKGRVPKYRLRNKIYFDEMLVDPMYIDRSTKAAMPTMIEWPGVPNEALVPENDVAKDIHAAYLESIGSVAKEVVSAQYVTAGGLVVNGRAPARREVGGGASAGEGLRIAHRSGSGNEDVLINVLGTVAAPARQSAASPATARANHAV